MFCSYVAGFGSHPDELFVRVKGDGGDAHLFVLVNAVTQDAVQELELIGRNVRLWKRIVNIIFLAQMLHRNGSMSQ